jgi:outer membrane lipoprotein
MKPTLPNNRRIGRGALLRWRSGAGWLLPLLLLSGCVGTYVIPPDLAGQADRSISFTALLENPDAFQGRKVALGGVILKARNLKEGTEIEVLELPLDRYDRPVGPVSDSQGRFLVAHPGYLETAVLRRGRAVTIVGDVAGKKIQKIDEADYSYPFIKADFVHVWRDDRRYGYAYDYPYSYPYPYPYPYYRWYDPWYPYGYYPWGPPVYYYPESGRHRDRRFDSQSDQPPPAMKDSGGGSSNSNRRMR